MKRKGMLSILFLALTVMFSLYSCSANGHKKEEVIEDPVNKVETEIKEDDGLVKDGEESEGEEPGSTLEQYTYENVKGIPPEEDVYEPEQYDGY